MRADIDVAGAAPEGLIEEGGGAGVVVGLGCGCGGVVG